MSRPQNSLSTLPQPQKQPIKAQKKTKMTLKLSQNETSELKETQKLKFVELHKQTLKQLSNSTQTPNIAHQDHKKFKDGPKIKQNQISEMTKAYKMKVVLLNEQTPKHLLNPSPTPKIARQGPKKSKMTPKLGQK